MTGPTHRQYSICFGLIFLLIVNRFELSMVNYYLALPITIMASKCGALFPDLDHDWSNVHDRTVLNKIINMIIHITGGKHRSWQTHSIDICVAYTVASLIIPKVLFDKNYISLVNKEIMTILLLGFASGWISHLFSDMLTSAGVRVICFLNFKLKFVPKKIFKFKFNTGHSWERFNYKLIKALNLFLGLVAICYPLILKK